MSTIEYKPNTGLNFELWTLNFSPRNAVECNLQMLGLIIMQNTLKPETAPVIAKLKQADLRVVMVTGKIV